MFNRTREILRNLPNASALPHRAKVYVEHISKPVKTEVEICSTKC